MKPVFVSDCEGPISKNDNAFELTSHFVLNGDKLFALISKYDDILADVVKKPGYNAGDTLKLVLPFLKAYNVTDAKMEDFSRQTLVLIAGSKITLKFIMNTAKAFIVSTSYEHYIKALCKLTDFPFENTYCTKLQIDRYALTPTERTRLKKIAREITAMHMPIIPPSGKSLEDFSTQDQKTVRRLDEIFWQEISDMSCASMFFEVNTVGGRQKAEAIKDITKKLDLPLSSVMYVGDSITDEDAFKMVRAKGGFTVSFNGNSYAVKNAEVAVISENNLVMAVLADVFLKHGREKALHIAGNWNVENLKNSGADPSLMEQISSLYPQAMPKVQIVTAENRESLVKESSEFRKKVRGEAVGKLG